jgi:hypothetical protein
MKEVETMVPGSMASKRTSMVNQSFNKRRRLMKNSLYSITAWGALIWAAMVFRAGADTIAVSLTLAHPLSTARTAENTVVANCALINSRIQTLEGISLAGVISTVEGTSRGYQASWIANVTKSTAIGMQTSGIVNVAKGAFSGLQATGVVNVASADMHGMQSGFINVAGDFTGLQVGIVNVSRHMDGVPVGIINIAGNGSQHGIVFGSTFSGVNAGAKFIVNNFHSVIAVGGVDSEKDYDRAVSFSTFWGYHKPLGPLFLEIDYGTMYMAESVDFDEHDPEMKILNTIRLGLGWTITPWLSVFGGAGGGIQSNSRELREPEPVVHGYGGVTFF